MMHESARSIKNEWLTPPKLIRSLGTFDLDPSAPVNPPWLTAKHHYSILDNGLLREWFGRVWLNPPYGKELEHWMNKMALHLNGIALTFARTDTNTFQRYVFPVADSILFIDKRLRFYNVDGTPAKETAPAPSVLIAYGEDNSDALNDADVNGRHILLNRMAVAVVSFDRTWKTVVSTVFVRVQNQADLNTIYEEVEKIAPDKIRKNVHYKAKIRQTLQLYFKKVNRGVYSN